MLVGWSKDRLCFEKLSFNLFDMKNSCLLGDYTLRDLASMSKRDHRLRYTENLYQMLTFIDSINIRVLYRHSNYNFILLDNQLDVFKRRIIRETEFTYDTCSHMDMDKFTVLKVSYNWASILVLDLRHLKNEEIFKQVSLEERGYAYTNSW